jgi:hypothetical protein
MTWTFLGRSPLISTSVAFATAAVAILFFSISDRAYAVGLNVIGTGSAAAQETFTFIQKNVPANALLSATKFRSFHLFTNHHTIKLLAARTPEELIGWLRRSNVAYIVLKYSPPNSEITFSDCPYSQLCDAGGTMRDVEEIWHNSDFRILRVAL